MSIFYARNNGEYPFKIEIIENESIKDNKIKIFKNHSSPFREKDGNYSIVHETSFVKYWIGYDSCCSDLENSILIQIDETNYIFVGYLFYKFQVSENEEIIQFVSDFGNNAIPYPYAKSASKTYLLLEKVLFDSKPKCLDPYIKYYNYKATLNYKPMNIVMI